MGANTFHDTIRRGTYPAGTQEEVRGGVKHISTKYADWPNAKEAFQYLGDQDRYENGHSYSGGIGMKHDFVHIATVNTYEEANELSSKLIQEADRRIDDKHGPAGCITIREGPVQFLFFGWASS